MPAIWLSSDLSKELINNNKLLDDGELIAKDIVSGVCDISTIVENLSGVLTDKNAEYRERGMQLFTNVLKHIPLDHLTETQLKFIVTFYSDRLKDNHRVIPPVLEGLLILSRMKSLPQEAPAIFFPVLFREVPCQQQVRSDRYIIFQTINNLLDVRLEDLQKLGSDFMYGVISAIDGERDPRNLMFIFSFLPKFIKSLNLGHLAEEMFEVISCYYPIDFHAPDDDPSAITRQDLSDRLCPCLCASPDFATFCMPLLIEKLDSSLRVAKIDSLKLLCESTKVFDCEAYLPFLNTLWTSFQRELSHKTDDELKMNAHHALYALIKKLSTSTSSDQTFDSFINMILISMQSAMMDAKTSNAFEESAKVLLTCANASDRSSILICEIIFPAIAIHYDMKLSDKLQIAALEFIARLYKIVKAKNVITLLDDKLKVIAPTCLTAVSEIDMEVVTAGLNTMIATVDSLVEDLVLPFVNVCLHNILYKGTEEKLENASVMCIHAIAQKYPDIIMNLFIKTEFLIEPSEDEKVLKRKLKMMCYLASIDSFTRTVMLEIIKTLHSIDISALVISTMFSTIEHSNLFDRSKILEIEEQYHLISSVLALIQFTNAENVNSTCCLIRVIMAALPIENQSKLLEKHVHQYLVTNTESLTHSFLFILEAFYSSVDKQVNVLMVPVFKLAFDYSLISKDEHTRFTSCALFANILNKISSEIDFNEIYNYLDTKISKISDDTNTSSKTKILLCSWIAKSLILRGDSKFNRWILELVKSLPNENVCFDVANGFKLIMYETKNALSEACKCRINIFYKQRIFLTFKEMVKDFTRDSTGPETRQALLLIWAYIMDQVPKTILKTEIDLVSNVIIEGISHNNTDLLKICLSIMSHLMQQKSEKLSGSLQSIIPRVLSLCTFKESMDVRMKSLQCMYDVASNNSTVLVLPYKQDVVFALAESLNDRKRLVRAMAVKARTRWCLVGSPGEDK